MKNNMPNQQHGFTIIELVIVMVVIGVLSAVAIPRLFELGGQARRTLTISVVSSLKTASELGYSQWVGAGQPTSIKIGNTEFYTSNIGYPLNTGNSAVTPMSTLECKNIWEALLKNPPVASDVTGCAINGSCKFEITLTGASDEICTFTDKNNNNITYNTSTGHVDSNVETILY